MTDIEAITLVAELVDEDAARDIAKAVSARHSIARKYVMWLRRRHPDATPADVIQMLERHYGASIGTVGAVIAASAMAKPPSFRLTGAFSWRICATVLSLYFSDGPRSPRITPAR